MINILTYCAKPCFMSVLMQSLADRPAIVKMHHDRDGVLKNLREGKVDLLLICNVADGMDLLQAIRMLDTQTTVVLVSNGYGYGRLENSETLCSNDIFIRDDISADYLLPKLQTLIRVCAGLGKPLEVRFGNLVFNYMHRELVFEDRKERLSKREADILKAFCQNRNNIMLKDEILNLVWGKTDVSAKKSFDVYLCNLKKILRQENSIAIRTVRGLGYIFNVEHT